MHGGFAVPVFVLHHIFHTDKSYKPRKFGFPYHGRSDSVVSHNLLINRISFFQMTEIESFRKPLIDLEGLQ